MFLTDYRATVELMKKNADIQEEIVEANVQSNPIVDAIGALIDEKVQTAIEAGVDVESAIEDALQGSSFEYTVERVIDNYDFSDVVSSNMPSGVDDFDFYSWSGMTPSDFVLSDALDEVKSEVEELAEKVDPDAFRSIEARLDAIEDAIRSFGGSI